MEFLLQFAIVIKNYIRTSKENIVIIYDEISSGKILLLLSALFSFTAEDSSTSSQPVDAYSKVIGLSQSFKEVSQGVCEIKNHIRYLNYFSNIFSKLYW